MKVVYKEVGKQAEIKEIKGDLREYQSMVGGFIETFHLTDEIILIINEEGKVNNLPINFGVPCANNQVEYIAGNVVVCTVKPMDGEIYGLEEEHLEFLEQIGFMK